MITTIGQLQTQPQQSDAIQINDILLLLPWILVFAGSVSAFVAVRSTLFSTQADLRKIEVLCTSLMTEIARLNISIASLQTQNNYIERQINSRDETISVLRHDLNSLQAGHAWSAKGGDNGPSSGWLQK